LVKSRNGEFKRCRFFTPRPLKFREPNYKRMEAWFVVLAVEPHPMPSLMGSLHWKVKEAGVRVGLETHTLDNLAVSGTRLKFLNRGKLGRMPRNASQRWTKTKI
jgi:hypothetical protein